jgi:hypothetical protein
VAGHGMMNYGTSSKTGSFLRVKTSIMSSFYDAGAIKNYISIRTEIIEAKQLNEKISCRASHDAITGLINRRSKRASIPCNASVLTPMSVS